MGTSPQVGLRLYRTLGPPGFRWPSATWPKPAAMFRAPIAVTVFIRRRLFKA